MKTRKLNSNESEDSSEIAQSKKEAVDFHSKRLSRELKIRTKKRSVTKPIGDDEYEQLVAEDADFNTRKIISEAAYFIAEKRGFSPGREVSDWLQAEIDVERLMRSSEFSCRQGLTEGRYDEVNLKL